MSAGSGRLGYGSPEGAGAGVGAAPAGPVVVGVGAEPLEADAGMVTVGRRRLRGRLAGVGHRGCGRLGLGCLLGGDGGRQLPGDAGLLGLELGGGGRGLAEGGGSAGLVGPILVLAGLELGLLDLQRVLGRVQLGEVGGDRADGQTGVLTGRLRPGGASREQGGVGARRVRPRVDVGADGLGLDDLEVAGDVLLVGA